MFGRNRGHGLMFLLALVSLFSVLAIALGMTAPVLADKSTEAAPDFPPDAGQDWKKASQWLGDQIEIKRKEAKLSPAKPCTDAEFCRRAYLDIIGTLPTRQEAREFIARPAKTDRKAPTKREALIEELLARPEYAENWARVWQRILTGPNADYNGAVLLQTHLRKSFAQNAPWDELTTELLTATGRSDGNAAIGFMMYFDNNNANVAGIVSKVFMGQQIQCAQCHNHPYEKWTMDDFAGMQHFFALTRSRRIQEPKKGIPEIWDVTESAVPKNLEALKQAVSGENKPLLPKYLGGAEYALDGDAKLRQSFAKWMTAPGNKWYREMAVNRYMQLLLGVGFVTPVDDFNSLSKPTFPEILDRMGKEFAGSGFDLKFLIRTICNSELYTLSSVPARKTKEDRVYFSHALIRRLMPEQMVFALMTATDVDGSGDRHDARKAEAYKRELLRHFNYAYSDDETARDVDDYSGSIPQALLIMNGALMATATDGKAKNTVQQVLKEKGEFNARLEELYLATLSRFPTENESARCKDLIQKSDNEVQAWEDIFWALLNCTEFSTNH
ncbi:MAG: DUF1549 domain-containing protein [Planctomycetes bacterium]|nr:DUF1549 domain-containing protein [Planctomycetota bacterium]